MSFHAGHHCHSTTNKPNLKMSLHCSYFYKVYYETKIRISTFVTLHSRAQTAEHNLSLYSFLFVIHQQINALLNRVPFSVAKEALMTLYLKTTERFAYKSAPDSATEVMTTDWIICPKHGKIKVHSKYFICTQTHLTECTHTDDRRTVHLCFISNNSSTEDRFLNLPQILKKMEIYIHVQQLHSYIT